MSVFSSAWVDGRIEDINSLVYENIDRRFMFILDTNFAIMARYYITDRDYFNKHYSIQKANCDNLYNYFKSVPSKAL
ncbi:hypothetical protein [Paenibacillus glacialis]|uniref:Uncharacterized protein n=1 Tax=Paenibacillus glacialis TaxID=494026 RepID=A0A162K2C8_9BACL|nr:hypothetical protein [Paenibacillus glacialis]OAB41996.1 hypothetical protein PGLA_14330 [Paenibacillus glacialis]